MNDFKKVTQHIYPHAKQGQVDCPICDSSLNLYQCFVNHIKRHRRKKEFALKIQLSPSTVSTDLSQEQLETNESDNSASGIEFNIDSNSSTNDQLITQGTSNGSTMVQKYLKLTFGTNI